MRLHGRFGLGVILLIGLVLRCTYFVGIGGFDDISYLKHVAEILNGTFSTSFVFSGEFPFRYRAGILFPTAAMFSVFGTSEYTAAVFPLLVSMATIWLAWRAGNLFSPLVAFLGALLIATLPIAVISATSLLPTLFSSFFCGLSIVWWIELEQLHLSRSARVKPSFCSRRAAKYFFVGVSLGCAYLFRIEASITGVVFIAFALFWCRPNRGWFVAAFGIVLVIGAENVIYYILHEEWFYRVQMISHGFAEVAAIGGRSPIENEKSLMVYVNALFVKPTDMGLHGAGFMVAAFSSLFLYKQSATRPILIWFWVWLLYLTFGTWSFDTYVPTTKNPRYLQNVCVPGAVLLAYVLAALIERRGQLKVAAIVGLGLILVVSALLVNPAWVYRYENAAGARVAAQMVHEELNNRHQQVTDELIQAEHYTAINLTQFLPEITISRLSFADIGVADNLSSERSAVAGYVVYDEFVANKYVDVVGYQIPAEMLEVPDYWTVVARRPRPNQRFQYSVVRWLSRLTGGRIQGLENSLKDGEILLYEVSG